MKTRGILTRAILTLFAFCTLLFTYDNCGGVKFSAGGGGDSTSNLPFGGEPMGEPPVPFTKTNCTLGYPYSSATPATNVVFNESDVLVGFSPQSTVTASPGLTVSVWYGDEHAMTLGVRQVKIITAAGTTSTDYPVSAMPANPGVLGNPQVGATALTGDQAGTDTSSCAGTDTCARPMYPALFITDTTANAASTSGDWQFGGQAVPPHAIYGTWKAAVRTIDQTKTPATVTVTPDPDPAKNFWNLGGFAAPAGVMSEGYGTVVSWDLSRLGLQSGHSYRLQFMVHDGDQNKTGGDAGQNCVNINLP